MVPRAGLEPAQRERRGILNPLCLPIPPPGHAILYCDAVTIRKHHLNVDANQHYKIYSNTRDSLSLRFRRDINLVKVAFYQLS